MHRRGYTKATIRPHEGVEVLHLDLLEVSLDCCGCERCRRTVQFEAVGSKGRCTPTGHEFNGTLIRTPGVDANAFYVFDYTYTPFTDQKYPQQRIPTGEPTWVRIHFNLTCPNCLKVKRYSSQTNLVRPWTRKCDCGDALFDDIEPPRLSWEPLAGNSV